MLKKEILEYTRSLDTLREFVDLIDRYLAEKQKTNRIVQLQENVFDTVDACNNEARLSECKRSGRRKT